MIGAWVINLVIGSAMFVTLGILVTEVWANGLDGTKHGDGNCRHGVADWPLFDTRRDQQPRVDDPQQTGHGS